MKNRLETLLFNVRQLSSAISLDFHTEKRIKLLTNKVNALYNDTSDKINNETLSILLKLWEKECTELEEQLTFPQTTEEKQ
jgi:hypothetical protein